MSEIKNVTVLGTGVLGAQIAFMVGVHGFPVTSYDISEDLLPDAKKRIRDIAIRVYNEVEAATPEICQKGYDNISYTADLAEAVKDADLVIEAVPENPKIKQEIYEKIGKLAPAKTIFCSNSSTMVPSLLMEYTGRPDRFMNLHYANHVWRMNSAECMPSPKTDPEVFETVVKFAEDTGMIPIQIKKEVSGYLLNSLLVPFLDAGCKLFAGGYAEPAEIDKAWRVGTGSPSGPFQILDIVGLNTAYNIMASSPDPVANKFAVYLKAEYIDQGKRGISTGEGFYKYNWEPTAGEGKPDQDA